MRICPLLAAAALLSTGLAARADTFAFSFGASSNSFSGPALNLAALLPPGSFPTPTNGGSFPANDNTLFVTDGIGTLSQDGLSFLLTGGAQINLYNDGPGNDAFLKPAVGSTLLENVPVSITAVASTPEPSGFALLGTGLLGLAGLVKRRLR